ncbi:MAG TPA: CHASE2 domain-containing protein, partial [Pyrinomonadaceae bacterium]|nr:CHASE2 domain-containing protein [Pyrinomonadaceae bacterium]
MRGKDIAGKPNQRRHANQAAWLVAIVIASAAAGMICVWLAPGLEAYARDRLMQARGPMAAPDDIVIVAIDEASIARFGRFPWSRDLTARALDKIAPAEPKTIALNVLYSEPTTEANDTALAESIARNRNTVVAAQLVDAVNEKGERQVQWLRPLPQIERASAGVGHVNISTESDGAARELPLRKSDNQGTTLWSIAVEAVRVADGLSTSEVQDLPGAVRLGARTLVLANDANGLSFAGPENSGGVVITRADRMVIDFIGPSGSFASRTYSFADVLDGKIPPERFRGKYVLVGATAATLGDQVASPFVHHEGLNGNQHGTLMPGVEVLANAVNTILRARFYRETPDWLAILFAALVAAGAIFALNLTQGRFETLKQLGALAGLVIALLAISYFAFTHWLIIPPVVPALVSLAVAAPLLLLRRSLVTSADLDERIAELSASNKWLTLTPEEPVAAQDLWPSPAEMIAQLTEADGVAIFGRANGASGDYRLLAASGRPTVLSLSKTELLQAAPMEISVSHPSLIADTEAGSNSSNGPLFGSPDDDEHAKRTLTLRLGKPDEPSGALVISHQVTREPHAERLRLSVELAAGYLARVASFEFEADNEGVRSLSSSRWRLP